MNKGNPIKTRIFIIVAAFFLFFCIIGCDEKKSAPENENQESPRIFVDPMGRFEIILLDESESARLIGNNTAVIHVVLRNTMETSILRLQGMKFSGDVYSLTPHITLGLSGEYTILAHQDFQGLNELALGIEDWWEPTGTLIAPGNEKAFEVRMPTATAKTNDVLEWEITEVSIRFGSEPSAEAIAIQNISVSHIMEKRGVVEAEVSPFSPNGASIPGFQPVLQIVISNGSVEPLVITDLSLQFQWQDAALTGWLENAGLVITSDQHPSSLYEQWGNLSSVMNVILDTPLAVPAKGMAILEVCMNTTGASFADDDWLQVTLQSFTAKYQFSHNAFGWWVGIDGGVIQY